MVKADQTRIAQVLNNLLVNAKQAMPNGGVIAVSASNVHVREGTVSMLPPGLYVRVCVEDQGVGIAKENLKNIFKMHFTTKKEGSGIGLSSCVYILKEHGGAIHVDSELGQGSTFAFFLPALDRVDPDALPVHPVDLPGSGRILVMDDDSMVQQTIGDMLSIFGYDVAFANDGVGAKLRYERAMKDGHPFVLVIMDLTIPGGMGGTEAIKVLKEVDPNVKAVVSSGNPNDPAMQHCTQFGFACAIQKPYNLKDLQNMLSRTIGQV
jgi:CheY-like chemotaxis protein